ncbi:hypothetical protein [Persicobacter sp. CCB-QB2]|uniref:hypothetical protein n=1 Tax=Persicobacter sp. CCB-QB2 TaxID=1561025 RepID=UPI0006A979A9|nr:hypothetical protein [Persicobacter sp. CCB-QB2]
MTSTLATNITPPLDLVQVKWPYNKFEKVEIVNSNTLAAWVENEYLGPHELAPMGLGEAGRHSAILGGMTLAHTLKKNSQDYYLAINAEVRRLRGEVPATDSSKFRIVSTCTFSKGKNGKVFNRIFLEDGGLLYESEIEITIIPETIFGRLFKAHFYEEKLILPYSPYQQRRPLEAINIDQNTIQASFGAIIPKIAWDILITFRHYLLP